MYSLFNSLARFTAIKSLFQVQDSLVDRVGDPDPAKYDAFVNQTLSDPAAYIDLSYSVNITVDECITACEAANGTAIEFWVPK